MIKQTRRTRSSGVHRAGNRAPINTLFVQGAVQSPPDQLEYLFEVRRRSRRRRHAPPKRRIQMGVRANHPGQYKSSAEIEDFLALSRFKSRTALDDPIGGDTQVTPLDRNRVEGYQVSFL